MTAIVTRVEHIVFENPWVRVYNDDVAFPGGRAGTYLRITHANDGTPAVIVPVSAGRIGLVRTYRYPLGAYSWEFPRGFATGDAATTAAAELREELGATARSLRTIGYLHPDTGLLATRVAVVVATCAGIDGIPTDTEEITDHTWIPVRALDGMVAAGDITCGVTLAAYTLAKAHAAI